MSVSGKELNPEDPATPCGLVAKSFFTDTYNLTDATNTPVKIEDDKGIAWESDIEYKFKNIKNPPSGKTWQDVQWINMENGKFHL